MEVHETPKSARIAEIALGVVFKGTSKQLHATVRQRAYQFLGAEQNPYERGVFRMEADGKTLAGAEPGNGTPVSIVLIAATSALYVLYHLFRDVSKGGNAWKQGDWLINSENVYVRRALSGDALLAMSDAIDISPLFLVAGVQAILVIFLYTLFVRILGKHDIAISLLILATPAIFILFWPADPAGSLRKELIAFVALTTLVYGIHAGKIAPQLIACVVLVVAFMASEATIFFAPIFVVLVLMSRDGMRPGLLDVMMISTLVISAVAALLFSVSHNQVADHQDVCRPLLERGLGENICKGAIWWLEKDTLTALNETWDLISNGAVTSFPFIYVFAFLPFLYITMRTENPWKWFIVIVLSGVVFAPLYAVGLDWGRWLSFHAFSVACLFLVAIRGDHLRFRQKPNSKVALLFLGLALVVTPAHSYGYNEGGIIKRLIF